MILAAASEFFFQYSSPALLLEHACLDSRQILFEPPKLVLTGERLLPTRGPDRPGSGEFIKASLLLLLGIASQRDQLFQVARPVAIGIFQSEFL